MRKIRRLRRKKNRKQTHLIIGMTLALLFVFTAGYAAFGTNISITAKGNLTTEATCTLNHEWTYDYENNKIYDLKIPCNGTYKLETWGAQGGEVISDTGGYGSYSIGTINLKRNQRLYIVVGGSGKVGISGYNGGGNIRDKINGYTGGGGGGATHIATEAELLVDLETYKGVLINNVYYESDKILIVSGGGGGAYIDATTKGGSGGGFLGSAGTCFLATDVPGTAGTQTSAGVGSKPYHDGDFGKGGNATNEGAGGAGFFGGASANTSRGCGGAGGSGYIANPSLTNKHMTCYKCTETADTDPEGIKTFSTDKVDENPKADTAKKGNGYAKITLISIG